MVLGLCEFKQESQILMRILYSISVSFIKDGTDIMKGYLAT